MQDQEPKDPNQTPEVLSPEDKNRLEGIHLTGGALEDSANNNLALAQGLIELLVSRGLVPAAYQELATDALEGISNHTQDINNLRHAKRIVTKEQPIGKVLDIKASAAARSPNPPPRSAPTKP